MIITQLPFAVPTYPLTEARCEAITLAGGNSFREYSIPEAVIKLKQGFGRLVRKADDKGIVVILDSRILTKGYGKIFLRALPDCKFLKDQLCIKKPAPPFGKRRGYLHAALSKIFCRHGFAR